MGHTVKGHLMEILFLESRKIWNIALSNCTSGGFLSDSVLERRHLKTDQLGIQRTSNFHSLARFCIVTIMIWAVGRRVV